LGWNKKQKAGDNAPYHNKVGYYFDGTQVTTTTREALAQLLVDEQVKKAKTVSIYHNGHFFWAVDFDASKSAVADGAKPNTALDDHRSSSGSADSELMDWTLVRFNTVDIPSGRVEGMSSVHIGGSLDTLSGTRSGQTWPQFLFPDRNKPEHRRNRNRTDVEKPFGSLSGDLCVLLALVAFAMSIENVHHGFTYCVRGNGWQAPIDFEPGIGRTDKRGMVITLYVRKPDEGEEEVPLDLYERLPFFS